AHRVRSDVGSQRAARGAYVLSAPDGPRDVTLIATGTEVALAVQAAENLRATGIHAAVVSMPCWELFDQQSTDAQAKVLGTAPRIAIEAAIEFGWGKWLRRKDAFIGMTGFGASARAEVLYDHFGITVQAIVDNAKSLLS
ncbi:MAG: transketolase-like TK C-terminal-containing protein, partial [Paracoccaceae bacterium]